MYSKRNFLEAFLLGALSITTFAPDSTQAETGKFGIGVAVAESDPAFIFRFWASKSFTIEPEFSVLHISPEFRDSQTRYKPGLRLVHHGRFGEKLRPLFGARLAFDLLVGPGQNLTDLHVGPLFGGEYFLADNFSISGEYHLMLIRTDDLASPDLELQPRTTYISTSQILSVNLYF